MSEYNPTLAYGWGERVYQYGCELESLVDHNNYIPRTWDGAESFNLDLSHWRLVCGNPLHWARAHDKPATSSQYPYNGMGCVLLKKNMQSGVNTLTQDMFYKDENGSRVPNTATIFVIKYDFMLDPEAEGGNIAIPENSVLQFEGGSITGNGITLTGNNTFVVGSKIIFAGMTFAGTWKNNDVDVSWFVENTDRALTDAITIGSVINLDKDISLTQNITISKSNITVKSKHKTITNGLYSIGVSGVSNVVFEGINFLGTETLQGNQNNALAFTNASNSMIKDCVLDGVYSYGFVFENSVKCSIINCEFKQSYALVRNMLCYGKYCDELTISGNRFSNIGYVYPVRIDICINSHIINNTFYKVYNNPILVNTGCAYCFVSGNYLNYNDDSGIIVANDPVIVTGSPYASDPNKQQYLMTQAEKDTLYGAGALPNEDITRETAHHISITKNVVKNSRATGIGLYNAGAEKYGYVNNVVISNNTLENNGIFLALRTAPLLPLYSNSRSYNFMSQMFPNGRNIVINGNVMKFVSPQAYKNEVDTEWFLDKFVSYEVGEITVTRAMVESAINNSYNYVDDVSGIFIQDTFPAAQASTVEKGENIIIKNNMCLGAKILGESHISTGAQTIGIKTDFGYEKELDLTMYIRDPNIQGYIIPQSVYNKYTWKRGATCVIQQLDEANKVIKCYSTSTEPSELFCEIDFDSSENYIFHNRCIFVIKGLVKIRRGYSYGSIRVWGISATRHGVLIDDEEYTPFEYSVLLHNDEFTDILDNNRQKVRIVFGNCGGGEGDGVNGYFTYWKDVKFIIKYI